MASRLIRNARLTTAATAALLVAVYAGRVWWDFSVKAWKVGWHGEPGTFFSADAIIFVVGTALAASLLTPWRDSHESATIRATRFVVMSCGVGGAVSVVIGVLVGAFGLLR